MKEFTTVRERQERDFITVLGALVQDGWTVVSSGCTATSPTAVFWWAVLERTNFEFA